MPTAARQLLEDNPELPRWVTRALAASIIVHRPPVQVLLVLFHLGCHIYGAYAAMEAAVAMGYADSVWPCGFRASLFFTAGCALMVVDWIVTLIAMKDKGMVSPWDNTKQAKAAVHKVLSEFVVVVIFSWLILWVPVVIWLRNAIDKFIVALILMLIAELFQQFGTCFSYSFWAVHNEMTQEKFAKQLVAGELAYEEAATAYCSVNQERKAVARGLGAVSFAMAFYALMMAIVLYDFEIRPWSGWPFFVVYVTQALGVILQFIPWLALHDWPNKLCAELMESAQLAWSPSDRTNFVTLVQSTKVRIALWDIEMSPGFRTAFPLIFFGWFLYMTELKQFHNFQGFPFDFPMCYNATDGEEGGHHH